MARKEKALVEKPSDKAKLLRALCRDLKPLLKVELGAGSKVEVARRAPEKRGISVFLERPFRVRHLNLRKSVYYSYIGEGGRWRAEYSCATHGHHVTCYF